MRLNFGLSFLDISTVKGLNLLDNLFWEYANKLSLTKPDADSISSEDYSTFLIEASPILDDFIAELFRIQNENFALRLAHSDFDTIYHCKSGCSL